MWDTLSCQPTFVTWLCEILICLIFFLRSERLLHWFNWQLTKILHPVAFLVFQSTSCPSFSLSCGPDGTLSALWATAMPGFTVTWEAVSASHASGRHWERSWPDWSGRQRPWLSKCLPGWWWSGHSKPPWRPAFLFCFSPMHSWLQEKKWRMEMDSWTAAIWCALCYHLHL